MNKKIFGLGQTGILRLTISRYPSENSKSKIIEKLKTTDLIRKEFEGRQGLAI